MGSVAPQLQASTLQTCAVHWLPLCRKLCLCVGVGSESNFCSRTQGAAGIIAVTPPSIYVVGTGISRGLQASLQSRPGFAHAAELCQAAGESCVALHEEGKRQKTQHCRQSIYTRLDIGIKLIASEPLYVLLTAA